MGEVRELGTVKRRCMYSKVSSVGLLDYTRVSCDNIVFRYVTIRYKHRTEGPRGTISYIRSRVVHRVTTDGGAPRYNSVTNQLHKIFVSERERRERRCESRRVTHCLGLIPKGGASLRMRAPRGGGRWVSWLMLAPMSSDDELRRVLV